MRKVLLYSASALIVLGAVVTRADDHSATGSLACAFSDGVSGAYEAGAFKMQPPSPISFAIESIDLEKLSAALDAGKGGGKGRLSIARAIGANHFLEIANEGFWAITTIYDKDPATGLHPAVHSRHMGVVGQPFVAQYTGSCRDM